MTEQQIKINILANILKNNGFAVETKKNGLIVSLNRKLYKGEVELTEVSDLADDIKQHGNQVAVFVS